jgi:hypothetical protein
MITINKKQSVITIVAIFAAFMIMGPVISSVDDVSAKKHYKTWSDCREDHSKNWCKKYFRNHDNDDNGNRASQEISQSQSSSQNSQCVSGGSTFASCNNLSFQNQVNTGNNALAQQ